MIRAIVFIAALAAFFPAGLAEAGDNEFIVVAHPSVGIDVITSEQLGRMFQKKMTQWPDGKPVVPVELGGDGATRQLFYRVTMDFTIGEAGSYWIRQAMTGGARPPRKFQSPEQVLKYVSITPGAVGYVPTGTELGEGVKRLQLR